MSPAAGGPPADTVGVPAATAKVLGLGFRGLGVQGLGARCRFRPRFRAREFTVIT